jgi:hypothetical protein
MSTLKKLSAWVVDLFFATLFMLLFMVFGWHPDDE